ncbi:MAG: glycosyltransferase family 1 protein [Pseudomonadota bacterium]|nr:glycosyltransferase family 1 protein [Pseudomonadota bacterium]
MPELDETASSAPPAERLRVIGNGWALHPPRSGVGVYTYELFSRLERERDRIDFRILMGSELMDLASALAYTERRPEEPPRFKAAWTKFSFDWRRPIRGIRHAGIVAYHTAHSGFSPIRRMLGRTPVIGDQLKRLSKFYRESRGARAIEQQKAEIDWREEPVVFHEPNFVTPFLSDQLVVTVHDFSFVRYRELHPVERLEWLTEGLDRTICGASRIIVPSEFTRTELLEMVPEQDPERVHVVGLGHAPDFRPRSADECAQRLKDYDLAYGRYCLFVGNLEPRKNLVTLLAAYERLPDSYRRAMPLVLVGAKGWRDADILARVEALEVRGFVRRLGFVPSEDLPVLYSAAGQFVYPTIYEGFGLPVLEALASGVPVISTRAASIPEVAGDAALLLEDPRDVDGLAAAIRQLQDEPALAAEMVEKGLRQARRFSWERCVSETLDVYRLAAEDASTSVSKR